MCFFPKFRQICFLFCRRDAEPCLSKLPEVGTLIQRHFDHVPKLQPTQQGLKEKQGGKEKGVDEKKENKEGRRRRHSRNRPL